MSWQDGMNNALAEYLNECYSNKDIAKVLDFEDTTRYGGYCETCAYEETVCVITYETSSGEVRTFDHYDSFANLVRSIT